jgi:ligand-binding sensor domain-containing protein
MTIRPPRFFLVGAFLALLAVAASAQTDMRFDHLTMDDGLSESIVLSIVQDRDGYLWFGTADGLNRFDGTAIKTFHANPSDTTTLSNNYVQRLFVDRSGKLWAGSLGGLDLYDPSHGSFRRIRLSDDGVTIPVFGIAESPRDSALWIATGAGLLVYRPDSGVVRRYRSDPARPAALHGANLTACLFDREGRLWVGSRDNGLSILDPATGTFRHLVHHDGDPRSLSHDFVVTITEDRNGTVWVGTDAGGVNRYDRRAGGFDRYTDEPGSRHELGHKTVRSIMEDRQGRLWVATDGGGLNRFDPVADTFHPVRHDALRLSSIANDRLTSLYEDRAGALWVGTWGSGVDRWSPSKDKFRSDPRLRPLLEALPNPFIISLFEDSRGMLWAGTHGGGAVGLQPSTGEIVRCLPGASREDRMADGAVWSIREDRDGDLWFATNQGVERFNLRTRTFAHFDEARAGGQGLGSRFAGRVEPAGDYVWVTTDKGLDRIDRRTDSVRNFPYALALGERPQGYVSGLTRDGDLILLGTSPISAFDTRSLRYVPSPVVIENINVSCMIGDGTGTLWIGTFGQGAYLLDATRASVRHVSIENGLPNNVVYGILPDGRGGLWMSTNKGIARLDTATGAVRAYDVSDGLQGNEFNRGAFCRARDGRLYFGGVNGLNSFHPDSIRANPYRPPVVFTAFRTFDEPLRLALAPGAVREIALGPSENYFSFEFAALDFTEPAKNQYAYMLEGFDKDWIHCGTRPYGGYTNLDPGTYVLRVKGANNDGLWNDEGSSVTVTILPPWWRTRWAYGLYLVLLVSGGVGARWLAQNWSVILASRKARYVAHYRLLEPLGKGGMGTVYRASDLRTKQVVALKVLAPELLQDPEKRKRLATEGRLLATFQHPHIVRVHEVGETAERSYIAMEYLPGGTLKERLTRSFPLPPQEVKRLSLEVAAGLAEIHARGVVHRDLKTGNVMLDGGGGARIMDFGLSKSPLVTTMTTLGTVIGTLGYTAPEQVTGVTVDHRADIFSFGVLLYELLTNRVPFGGENEIAVIHALFNTDPRPPSSVQPGFPPAIDAVVLRCLERDPARRYATVEELRLALDGGFW